MKVLFASRYVDPNDSHASQVILKQARTLRFDFSLDVEILTWPNRDHWNGVIPSSVPTINPLLVDGNGIPYHVINCPQTWNEIAGGNCINSADWDDAVEYGVGLLKKIQPDIFHLHHRFGFWWLLESAQRLGIPTIYTNYDWGIACLRTVLVNSDGKLCDGFLTPQKCSECIVKGRKSLLAILNEKLARLWIGEKLLSYLEKTHLFSQKFRLSGAVSISSLKRTVIHQTRVNHVISNLNHLITPSEFGKSFFEQFGINSSRVSVLPWFHDVNELVSILPNRGKIFRITYFGRVSEEKGVHLIFKALENLFDIPEIEFCVASANNSDYCQDLKKLYFSSAGHHRIIWYNWSQNWEHIGELIKATDLSVIPSTCMDNTPLTLIESMAYRVPIIATSIPTITGLAKNEGIGYFAQFDSVESLSMKIKEAYNDRDRLRKRNQEFPLIDSSKEYASKLIEIYKTL